jgi:hypothetical protein
MIQIDIDDRAVRQALERLSRRVADMTPATPRVWSCPARVRSRRRSYQYSLRLLRKAEKK